MVAKKKINQWEHTGGGCDLMALAAGDQYPCDDSYENTVTHETVEFFTTREAHANMPDVVDNLSQIRRMKGVKKNS